MAGRTTLKLTDKDKAYLRKIIRKKSVEARVVARAKILLHKADGLTIDEIAQIMKIHRNTVILCLRKFREGGLDFALNDKPRKISGRGHGVTPEGRDWVISVASREPQYAGLLDSSWSYEALTSYLSKNARRYGFPELENVSKTTIRRILSTADNASLKLRRNDNSQHRHDGDVQLSIPIDDFLSASAPGWQGHEPGEQLSMSMMFDLYADAEGEPLEEPQDDDSDVLIDDDADVLIEDDSDVLIDSDKPIDPAISSDEPIETESAEDEDIALDEAISEDDATEDEIEEQEPSLEEGISVSAEDAVPEDAPETAPVEDIPQESSVEDIPEESPVEETAEDAEEPGEE